MNAKRQAYASVMRLGLFTLAAGAALATCGERGPPGGRGGLRANEHWLHGHVANAPHSAHEPGPLQVLPLGPDLDCLPVDPPPPVVKVKVRVAAVGAANQPIEYRICVENCSTAEAHHVILKNPLPANAEFVRAEPEPTRMVPELQWHFGTIGGGACREVVLVLKPTDGSDVKNCTRVQFEHGQCVTTRIAGLAPGMPAVPLPGKEPMETKEPPPIPADEMPKLTLTIEGHKQQYVNLASHYFITVTNNGKRKAGNALVSCLLPEQLRLVRASTGGKHVQNQVAWVLGDLEPGGKRTVELVAKAMAEGTWCVKGTARADLGVTAAAEACTQFLGVSALHVELADRNDPIAVGGKTSYPILIRNPGSAAVTNVRIKAFVPAGMQLLDVKGVKFQVGAKDAKGQWIELPVLDKLPPLTSQTYELFVEARRAGATRVHVEVSADQLERGPVIDEESTTLFED